ncbi:glycosyl hydrolase 115 family protein [Mangrovibacterium marinum]|uniref:glycosyl hydrolase 115 family protein n=1 Tax=Mangrovibacterium marinum TaxID=1639118 RepID=UPI002A1892F1|nr:glycosyl hydrolase 115 family protein [Mangrovibacterium marinum]
MVNRLSCILFFALVLLLLSNKTLIAGGLDDLVLFERNEAGFVLSDEAQTAPIFLGESEYEGVKYVANLFAEDLKRIGLAEPKLIIGDISTEKNIVLIGTVGQNPVLDKLEKSGKLDLSDLRGQWEKSLVQVVENPFPGVDKALVLAGSDKRGTIYAMLNLSRDMGVSPWYWWADVPVDQHSVVSINVGRFVTESPKVKYRGIFLNDEEPALGGWVRGNFGDFNAKFYSHLFELILRLHGNYLWPAMWGKAFFDDDPENGRLADELGIVIGTSHHEPLGRAHDEWRRYGSGPWDYSKNAKVLTAFWTKGMERMKDFETIVTVGMRGDGDEAMSEGTNIALLEKIVRDQRKIISKVTGKKAEDTPQMWALYKEVQDYYDKGMRVPDDVTLLLCDDNWGDVRKLPNMDAPKHPGGYGMYYHFDYVGGPRNYKWMNVSQIQRVWEQMNLTYSHGVDRVWIVNVGDLKPMEYPISFFLDMAWNPEQFNAQNLFQHTVDWCAEQFGEAYAEESARIIDLYTKYNHRVTPELLDENTFSLENYNEFERVRNDYRDLAMDALRLYNLIPIEYKDAFDQLVLFPTNASSNLYEMYYAVAKNHQLAEANDPAANNWADEVQKCFDRDSLLTAHYNQQIAGGKWNHQMDQIRIGYTYWQQPEVRKMPEVFRVEVPEMPNSEKVFVEGDGYVSIEASNFQQSKGSDKIHWNVIPGLGRTGSGITTFPQNEYPADTDSVYLKYAIRFNTTGKLDVHVLVSPSLNFNANKGLRYAISIDGGEEQIVNINGEYRGELGQWQAERIIEKTTAHEITTTGVHRLRIRLLEPGIVLQKILIDCGGLKPSFLGAPQSELKKPE